MVKRLEREELIQLVENVIHPKGKGFTSEEINLQLLHFCVNCPDPVAAMKILLEAPRGSTAVGIVEKAFECPPRDPNSLPETALAKSHPLRRVTLNP